MGKMTKILREKNRSRLRITLNGGPAGRAGWRSTRKKPRLDYNCRLLLKTVQ